jgi:pantoate--beta-alanine ligase
MRIIYSLEEIGTIIKEFKQKGQKTGFVPTMGALHDGHISLVKHAKAENDIVVVSIFVNPTQFNDKKDLANYPRMIEKDIALLQSYNVDYIFAPDEQEMYPESDSRMPDNMVFEFGDLDKILEGKYRPGHFNGVAQIVYKFFKFLNPDKAYFGEKDFQQVIIIKHLIKTLNLNIEIVSCPIVRESDGLAMSSRNMLLLPDQRKSAILISRSLRDSLNYIDKLSIAGLKEMVCNNINKDNLLEVEYFEIVNDTTLLPVSSWNDPAGKVGLIAVRIGKIRLIDNIRYNA